MQTVEMAAVTESTITIALEDGREVTGVPRAGDDGRYRLHTGRRGRPIVIDEKRAETARIVIV